jgi:ribosomal protein S17E
VTRKDVFVHHLRTREDIFNFRKLNPPASIHDIIMRGAEADRYREDLEALSVDIGTAPPPPPHTAFPRHIKASIIMESVILDRKGGEGPRKVLSDTALCMESGGEDEEEEEEEHTQGTSRSTPPVPPPQRRQPDFPVPSHPRSHHLHISGQVRAGAASNRFATYLSGPARPATYLQHICPGRKGQQHICNIFVRAAKANNIFATYLQHIFAIVLLHKIRSTYLRNIVATYLQHEMQHEMQHMLTKMGRKQARNIFATYLQHEMQHILAPRKSPACKTPILQ